VGDNLLTSYDKETSSDVISATLLQEGGVIVRNQATDDLVDKVAQEAVNLRTILMATRPFAWVGCWKYPGLLLI
jgi:hypothetical protein